MLPGGGHEADIGPPAPLVVVAPCDLVERIDTTQMVLADTPVNIVCDPADYPSPAGGRTVAMFFFVDYVASEDRYTSPWGLVRRSFDEAGFEEPITIFNRYCDETIALGGRASGARSTLFDIDRLDIDCV